ncbi:MAG: hypothetical protein K1Y02_06170 [Candidatus Hydrogenedentes bacterium]|nr:hypothetical protein [Candidatus Hydrogenedentota bacterium]
MAQRVGHRPSQEDQMRQAAREIYAPKHEDRHFLRIHPHVSSIAATQSEVWERKGDSLTATKTKSVVVTCSDSVVAPEQITARCYVCKGYDSIETRCHICARSLCRLHAVALDGPNGLMILCPEHAEATIWNWDVWSAMDNQRSSPRNTQFPPIPRSTSSMQRPK